jgi:hypothetical protein
VPIESFRLTADADFYRFGTLTYDLSPAPLPTALPLFGTGLGILGIAQWVRRRRRALVAVRV